LTTRQATICFVAIRFAHRHTHTHIVIIIEMHVAADCWLVGCLRYCTVRVSIVGYILYLRHTERRDERRTNKESATGLRIEEEQRC